LVRRAVVLANYPDIRYFDLPHGGELHLARTRGEGVTEKVVWHVVKEFAKKIGVAKLAPHDLGRTCARLCHSAVGELEQIQFLLGHVSVQTTERYLGRKQRIRSAVNDRIGIEPTP
jgi:integrase